MYFLNPRTTASTFGTFVNSYARGVNKFFIIY